MTLEEWRVPACVFYVVTQEEAGRVMEDIYDLAVRRPAARPDLIERGTRISDPQMRAAYVVHRFSECMRRGEPLFFPCGWCGELSVQECVVDSCRSRVHGHPEVVCCLCRDRYHGKCRYHASSPPAHRASVGRRAG